MKRFAIVMALIGAVIAGASSANATVINFSGAGGSGPTLVKFQGVAQAAWNGAEFVVTNIVSGTQTQGAVTSAITGVSLYAAADEKLSGPSNHLLPDFSGLSWTTASLGDFNWYTWNGGQFELSSIADSVGYPQNGVPLAWSYAGVSVPEPLSLAFLASGLIGLAALRRRKAQQASVRS